MHFIIHQGWVARLCCSWLSLGESDRDFFYMGEIPIGTEKCTKDKYGYYYYYFYEEL